MEDLSIDITIKQKQDLISALNIAMSHRPRIESFNKVYSSNDYGLHLRISNDGLDESKIDKIYNSYSKRLSEFKDNEHLVNIYFYGYVFEDGEFSKVKNAYAITEDFMSLTLLEEENSRHNIFKNNDFLKTKLFLAFLKFAKFAIENKICDVKPDNTLIRLAEGNIFTFFVINLDNLELQCALNKSGIDPRIQGLKDSHKLLFGLHGKNFSLIKTKDEDQLVLINTEIQQVEQQLKTITPAQNADLNRWINHHERRRKEATQKMPAIIDIFKKYQSDPNIKFKKKMREIKTQKITEAPAVAVGNPFPLDGNSLLPRATYEPENMAMSREFVNPSPTSRLDNTPDNDPIYVNIEPLIINEFLTVISNGTMLELDKLIEKYQKNTVIFENKPKILSKFQENIIKSIPIIEEIFREDIDLTKPKSNQKIKIELQKIWYHIYIIIEFFFKIFEKEVRAEINDKFANTGINIISKYLNKSVRINPISLIDSLIKFYELVPYKVLYDAIIEKKRK